MELDELRKVWKTDHSNADAVSQLWNGMAPKFGKRGSITPESNTFLKLVAEKVDLTCDTALLDVGCGAGDFTLALAPNIGRGVGCDIASKMLETAREHAQQRGIQNAEFLEMDWRAADIDALGWRGAFDVVFAHMTPAVCDFETLDKLVRCTKKHCFMKKPARRTDLLLDTGMDLLGLRRRDQGSDITMEYTFSYLWKMGFEPEYHYEHSESESIDSVDAVVDSVLRWAALQRNTTESDEAKLREYFSAQAEDGMVRGHRVGTTVTIDWAV
jgi:SAM-dependent methyltransferase